MKTVPSKQSTSGKNKTKQLEFLKQAELLILLYLVPLIEEAKTEVKVYNILN